VRGNLNAFAPPHNGFGRRTGHHGGNI
jgi:hypothetical protein